MNYVCPVVRPPIIPGHRPFDLFLACFARLQSSWIVVAQVTGMKHAQLLDFIVAQWGLGITEDQTEQKVEHKKGNYDVGCRV